MKRPSPSPSSTLMLPKRLWPPPSVHLTPRSSINTSFQHCVHVQRRTGGGPHQLHLAAERDKVALVILFKHQAFVNAQDPASRMLLLAEENATTAHALLEVGQATCSQHQQSAAAERGHQVGRNSNVGAFWEMWQKISVTTSLTS